MIVLSEFLFIKDNEFGLNLLVKFTIHLFHQYCSPRRVFAFDKSFGEIDSKYRSNKTVNFINITELDT